MFIPPCQRMLSDFQWGHSARVKPAAAPGGDTRDPGLLSVKEEKEPGTHAWEKVTESSLGKIGDEMEISW